MKKKVLDISKLHYIQVRDLEINFSIPDDVNFTMDEADKIKFSFEISKMLNLNENIIRILFVILLTVDLGNSKVASLSYQTEHLFNVENLPDLITNKGDGINVDETLDRSITNIAYSTVRGLLIQKTNGTWFTSFIMPVYFEDNKVQ